jgi:hypothetical protein
MALSRHAVGATQTAMECRKQANSIVGDNRCVLIVEQTIEYVDTLDQRNTIIGSSALASQICATNVDRLIR